MSRRDFLTAAGLAPTGCGILYGQTNLRFVAIADLNGSYGTVGYSDRIHRAVRRIIELRPAVVLIAGDMIAGQRPGRPLSRTMLGRCWSAFDRTVVRPLCDAGVPVAPAPGNHDAALGSVFAEEREAYRHYWNDNRPRLTLIDSDRYPFEYAFRVGSVRFVAIDAVDPGRSVGQTLEWLSYLLRFSDDAPVVAFGHLPMAPIAHGRETEYLRDARLLSFLAERRITTYVSGHHHAFFDGCESGLRQVFVGALGDGPRVLGGTHERSPYSFSVLSIDQSGLLNVVGLQGPDFSQPIATGDLPKEISLGSRRVVRSDSTVACRNAGGGS